MKRSGPKIDPSGSPQIMPRLDAFVTPASIKYAAYFQNTSRGLGLFFCDLRVCFFLLGENLLKYFSQLILSVKLIFFFLVSLQKM